VQAGTAKRKAAALPWKTAWRVALDRAGSVILVTIGLALGVMFATGRLLAIDSPTFWNAGHATHYYSTVWASGLGGSYVYPPPLAQVVGLLPWPAYIIGWTTLLFVGWWAATRAWALPTFVLSVLLVVTLGYAFPLTNALDLTAIGNPQILIAAVCVIGFRWPAAWAFVLLTKVAPGVGFLLVRGTSGMALAWYCVGRDGGHCRRVVRTRAGSVGRLHRIHDRQCDRRFTRAGRPHPIPRPATDIRGADRVGRSDEPAVDGARRSWVGVAGAV